jgi:hypothetical protein
MVEQITREFKAKQRELQPLVAQLKAAKADFQDVESTYLEKKATYDKVAVGLDMEKTALEKECTSWIHSCMLSSGGGPVGPVLYPPVGPEYVSCPSNPIPPRPVWAPHTDLQVTRSKRIAFAKRAGSTISAASHL